MRLTVIERGRRSGAAVRIVLAACILVCGATAAFAEGTQQGKAARTISVSGTGQVLASPDMAVVRLGVETRDRNLTRALADATRRISAITASLESLGVAAKEIQTVSYNIGFVADTHGSGRPTEPPATMGSPSAGSTPSSPGGQGSKGPAGYFQVSDVAAVTVRELSKLGPILDGALSAGANRVDGVSFRIADPAPLEKKARAAAYRAAHEQALQLAKLSGQRLGRVLRIEAAGSPGPVVESGFRAALAAPAVNPGQLSVHVTLHVVYALRR